MCGIDTCPNDGEVARLVHTETRVCDDCRAEIIESGREDLLVEDETLLDDF